MSRCQRYTSDYGKLGHAEVVRLRIPPSSFPAFAKEYFALFDEKGNRPDQSGDVRLEYRNLVGIPGETASIYAKQLVEVHKRMATSWILPKERERIRISVVAMGKIMIWDSDSIIPPALKRKLSVGAKTFEQHFLWKESGIVFLSLWGIICFV
jgi:hypothetical protein